MTPDEAREWARSIIADASELARTAGKGEPAARQLIADRVLAVFEAGFRTGALEVERMRVAPSDAGLTFRYLNHRGEEGLRQVRPYYVWYGETKYYEGMKWYLRAWDIEKQAERDFALDRFLRE